jgi:RNA polymerase sigma-70 factor (ECF subfamily)
LDEAGALGAAVRNGDEAAFTALAERHRRELFVHCYRMLASLDDAEDAVQDTFLRAWRYRESVREGLPLRPWLYRIATNACLDAIARDPRRTALAAASELERPGTEPHRGGVAQPFQTRSSSRQRRATRGGRRRDDPPDDGSRSGRDQRQADSWPR